ncbi:MAG: hypothetical protein AAF329_06790 [Cyanobacteria bacterium P01_A01_bin.17]
MIIKSSQRAGAKQLANHLTKTIDDDNRPQQVTFSAARHFMPDHDVHSALNDMAVMAWASPQTEKHLYHASINPSAELNADQWQRAFQVYEQEFDLHEAAFIEVTHCKEGRTHRHRVYERVNVETQKALKLSFTRVRNEKVARILEYEFGHPLTIGKHNRAVMRRLEEEGHDEIVAWMSEKKAHEAQRPQAELDYSDVQQQRRTKVSKRQVKAELNAAFARSDDGRSFEQAIAEQGYLLCRGDRRDYVVVDATGNTHSPRRMLGVKAKDLRARWQDLDPQQLPTVSDVQRKRGGQQSAPTDTEDAIERLEAEKVHTEQEIERLEHQLARELTERLTDTEENQESLATQTETVMAGTYAPPKASSPKQINRTADESAPNTADEIDQRQLLERIHWHHVAEVDPERSRPQDFSKEDVQSWGLSRTTITVMQTYIGKRAEVERNKRLQAAMQTHEPASKRTAVSDYLVTLGQRLKQKGRSYYRQADYWLTQRLAKLGYSRAQTRQALAIASPELMEEEPEKRVAYIHRTVNRIYRQREHQTQINTERKKAATARLRRQTVSNSIVSERRHSPESSQRRAGERTDEQPQTHRLNNRDTRQQRLKMAYQALDSKDFQNYRGQATREYRKDLARKLRAHGREMIEGKMGEQTDRDIAIRLYGTGFSQKQVRAAVLEASPQVVGKSPEGQTHYVNETITPLFKNHKVRQMQQVMWDWRNEQGLRFERRLTRVGLASETLKPKPDPQKHREQSREQRR